MSLEPTEAELLRSVVESILSDVHTSIPGRVVKYNATTQTADVEIVVQRAEIGASGAIVHETYPVIPNVPVGWMSGNGYSFQFTLAVGDGVWLVFSEAAIANWRETGELSPPGDTERHDLSYPIALPIARHSKQPLPLNGVGAMLRVPEGGSLNITSGSAPAFVPRDDRLQTELNRIKDDIATLKSAISDGFGAINVAAGSAFNGATLCQTPFDGATASIPSNPGTTASATLKAQ